MRHGITAEKVRANEPEVFAGRRERKHWHFRVHPRKHVPVIEGERVFSNGETILERPDDKDREDAERLTQTHLEQVSENQKFRVLARFFGSVRLASQFPGLIPRAGRSDPLSSSAR